jgi:hypothetical protein
MTEEWIQRLQANLHIVLHCAAVVDFNERLDRAVELNVMGNGGLCLSLRLRRLRASLRLAVGRCALLCSALTVWVCAWVWVRAERRHSASV